MNDSHSFQPCYVYPLVRTSHERMFLSFTAIVVSDEPHGRRVWSSRCYNSGVQSRAASDIEIASDVHKLLYFA